jgi:hypothetical protein
VDFENEIMRDKEAESILHAVESAGGPEVQAPGCHLSERRCRAYVYDGTAALSKPC